MKRFKLLYKTLPALALLTTLVGCTSNPQQTAYNPVALRPRNPNDVVVKVSLRNQAVYVMEGKTPLLVCATTVGIPNKPTPNGHFKIFKKDKLKRSGSYGFWVNGDAIRPGESCHSTVPGGHYVGYPMAYWCEFSPTYGFHQGYVWPMPRTHGCLRLHANVAPKFYELVKVGTPVYVAASFPEDATLGAKLRRPTDYNDPDPPAQFMISPRVFDSHPNKEPLLQPQV